MLARRPLVTLRLQRLVCVRQDRATRMECALILLCVQAVSTMTGPETVSLAETTAATVKTLPGSAKPVPQGTRI